MSPANLWSWWVERCFRPIDARVLAGLRISLASVVFPVPGGPHRIIECSAAPSIALRRGFPGVSR